MIEHRPMTDTATVAMPLNEYDKMKMDSIKYGIVTNTLFDHAAYDEKNDDLFFLFSAEQYVRSILKEFEPERYAALQEQLKQKYEEQAREDF